LLHFLGVWNFLSLCDDLFFPWIEPRSSHMLGMHSTTELYLSPILPLFGGYLRYYCATDILIHIFLCIPMCGYFCSLNSKSSWVKGTPLKLFDSYC
jgi:hypothetical protein